MVETPTLLLSEAIREGAKLHPQGFGRMCIELPDGTRSTCAYGAAFEGAGESFDRDYPGDTRKLFESLFPALKNRRFLQCPASKERGNACVILDLYGLMFHLNDSHRWKRLRIADWLSEQGY